MGFFKRCFLVFLLFTLFLGMANLTLAAEPVRKVRVGAYNNKPKIYKDNNDEVAGVFADIINFIAEKENWDVEYIFGSWDEGLTRLEEGEIDIMVDVAISEEREERFDFTQETVLNSWAVIYVQKDSAINSLLDLEGKKISILASSVYEKGEGSIEEYLEAFGLSATIVEVKNYREALDLLELGRVDAAVVSYISGLAIGKDYSNLRATKIFLKPTELRFALTKGDKDNPYLIEKLDYWVKKLRDGSEGYLHDSLERHGLSELEAQAKPQTQPELKGTLPAWVFPVVKVWLAVLASWGLIRIITSRRTTKKK
jgi:ABC-type amino acid transport substrate-binding protein